MRLPEKRKEIMARSIALGHCVCNPKQPCPCDILINSDLCPCAGERPDPPKEKIRLTQHVRKVGCSSKINHNDLMKVLSGLPSSDDPNVIIGVAAGDDAGVYRLEGKYNLVQTVDVFSPAVDDPYIFGQICAANSLSDVYAMGGRPICALSIIGFPIEELPHETMADILRGGIDVMNTAGVSVIGGHSINDAEIKCGFAVSGLIDGKGSVTNAGARSGDCLVLTKPIGTGVIAFAAQIGRASDAAIDLIGKTMAELNKDAAELMLEFGAHACTDVTGFSLMGHLTEMARHSGVSAVIDLASVPFFAEALGSVRQRIIPGAIDRNKEAFSANVRMEGERREPELSLLFDAQTSGGLLIALPEEHADAYVEAMRARGHTATSRIGCIMEMQDFYITVKSGEPANLIGEYREIEAPHAVQGTVATANVEPPPMDFACCEHPPQSTQNTSTPKTSISHIPPASTNGPASQSAEAFKSFMKAANSPGRLDARMKRLMNIALAVATRCDHCLQIHIEQALSEGLTREEIDEAAWLAISFSGAPAKLFYEGVWRELSSESGFPG
ncbi:MAG: selenide, water dikinase SelD [Candidatus Omnitrophota bacterium]|jgi:selenide,water dikinase|nr:MAG: selenide, water dikinase SelD [Candidatus Omnitrophota bacterium]